MLTPARRARTSPDQLSHGMRNEDKAPCAGPRSQRLDNQSATSSHDEYGILGLTHDHESFDPLKPSSTHEMQTHTINTCFAHDSRSGNQNAAILDRFTVPRRNKYFSSQKARRISCPYLMFAAAILQARVTQDRACTALQHHAALHACRAHQADAGCLGGGFFCTVSPGCRVMTRMVTLIRARSDAVLQATRALCCQHGRCQRIADVLLQQGMPLRTPCVAGDLREGTGLQAGPHRS